MVDKTDSMYQNPALTADLVVFGYQQGQLSVLLLNRKEQPFINEWTLPGGFVALNHTLQQTCQRVLREKLGIDSLYLAQVYTFDQPGRDPRGHVVSVAYYSLVNPATVHITTGKMANDVRWFPVRELPALAFDHAHIFQVALQRLRNQIQYQPVGFQLLDELFTMPELHALYECILATKIDRRNFARKVQDAGLVVPTGERREGVRNRLPELFRFNQSLIHSTFHLNITPNEH